MVLLKVFRGLFIVRHAAVDTNSCGYSGGWHYGAQGDIVLVCERTERR